MNKADIAAAIALIATVRPDIANLLRTIPITTATLDSSTLAQYGPTPAPHIEVSEAATFETEDLAASLIHEGTHALDQQNGILGSAQDLDALIPSEQRAKRVEVDFIKGRNPAGKPVRDVYDEDINRWIADDKVGNLDSRVAQTYLMSYLGDMLGISF